MHGSKTINCINNGIVKGAGERIGGVIGELSPGSIIAEKCVNNGEVTGGTEYTGGVVGIISTDGKDPSDMEITTVRQCYNVAKVTGGRCTGGVIGQPSQYNSLVEKCYNLGEIIGTVSSTGGIVGSFGRGSRLYNCYNKGRITGVTNVGGIAGNSYASACQIKNCYNTGELTGTTKVGGIIGNNGNSTTIENSYYLTGTAGADQGGGTTTYLAKDKAFITTDFVQAANSEETVWITNSQNNDGWPALSE